MKKQNTKQAQVKNMGYFRSYDFSREDPKVILCKHLSIKGSLLSNDEGCEYTEGLEVTCNLCNKIFYLTECIN